MSFFQQSLVGQMAAQQHERLMQQQLAIPPNIPPSSDYVPAKALYEAEQKLKASEELSRVRFDVAVRWQKERDDALARVRALEGVFLAACRYSKAQSARYQRELIEAIDQVERTPK